MLSGLWRRNVKSKYVGEVVYLTDLIDRENPPRFPILENYVFIRCHLRGPAVIALDGFPQITDSHFDDSPEDMAIEVPEGRPLVGILVLRNVRIDRCRITEVGVVMAPRSLHDFVRNLTPLTTE